MRIENTRSTTLDQGVKSMSGRAFFTLLASSDWSVSSSSSIRNPQVASLPLPFNQYTNISRQHATGPFCWLLASMSSRVRPSESKSRRSPSSFHCGATDSMILIFSPVAVFIIFSWASFGFLPVREETHSTHQHMHRNSVNTKYL